MTQKINVLQILFKIEIAQLKWDTVKKRWNWVCD